MRTCAAAVVLAAVLVPPLAARADTTGVPFRLRDTTDIVVPVTVGGRGPLPFLLDTGSTRSAITLELAKELGLQPAGRTGVVTPGGEVGRALAYVPIEFAGVRLAGAAMLVASEDLGAGVCGVIGADLVAARPFTIDYERRRVLVGASSIEPGTPLALSYGVNGFLVTIPGRAGQTDLRLVPDSGTSALVLFDRRDRALPAVTPLGPVPLRTLAGVTLARAVLLELQIGGVHLREQHAVIVPASNNNHRLAHGLLPLHLFAQVTFDAAKGTLWVSPR